MSKRELVEFISGTYPDVDIRRYPGREGYLRLYAIYKKLIYKYGGSR